MTDDPLLILLYGLVLLATFGLIWTLLRWLFMSRHSTAILDRLITTAAHGGDRTAVEDELAAHRREETRGMHDYMVWMWAWLLLTNVTLWYAHTTPWINLSAFIGWTVFCIWKW